MRRHRKKRCPIPQATLTTLPALTILRWMERFCQLHPTPKSRGRPPIYPEAFILTLALLQVRDGASWRQLRYARLPKVFPTHALPALRTLL
ncbi:MAG: hypothetical protein ACK4ME_06190 [Fimbriimonadales bacterium]